MQVNVQDLTVPEVYEDISKNLCNIINSSDDEDDDTPVLCDILIYTETDFVECKNTEKIQNDYNVTIITLNVSNLLSKLRFFKLFVSNIITTKNRPDVINVVETHITVSTNHG